MNPGKKTALAVVAGVVIGLTLFGGALASHALVRTVVFGQPAGRGVMAPRGAQGAMPAPMPGCPSGGACAEDGRVQRGCPDGACPNGDRCAGGTCTGGECSEGACGEGGCAGGACPNGDRGMMQPGTGAPCAPQGGMDGCPDGGACPSVSGAPTTES